MSALPALRDPNSLSKWLEKPLWYFLKENARNVDLFIGYLSECFALENMLFLERSIILYHLIRKCQKQENETRLTPQQTQLMNDKSDVFMYPCYKLKFVFLTQIYADIETMIQNGCKQNDKNEKMKYKHGIIEAMKCIYQQFCSTESENEINIAYEVRNTLCGLFGNKTDDEVLKQFDNYDDLLPVYHEAIVECWNLCITIYGFQFKQYLRKHVVRENENAKENVLSLMENDSAKLPKMKKITQGKSDDDIKVDAGGNVEN
eukprot:393495_1